MTAHHSSTEGAAGAPSVSVIIPVYNDRERLVRCLTALQEQTYPEERYEVIVVDNGSDESPATVTDSFDNVRLVVERQRGSYAARNKGLAVAEGALLAFTDADCVPMRGWLEQGVACFEATDECGLVAGKVELTAQREGHPTACERYDQLFYLDQERAVKKGRYGATANLFTSQDVIRAVGPFDATLLSSGDNEWGQRVYREGFRQAYCAEAVVRHPARRSLKALLRKEVRVAGGLASIEEASSEPSSKKRTVALRERLRRLVQPFRNALGVIVGSTSRQIPSVWQRVQVGGIILLVHYLRQLEMWRVQRGGTPRNA